ETDDLRVFRWGPNRVAGYVFKCFLLKFDLAAWVPHTPLVDQRDLFLKNFVKFELRAEFGRLPGRTLDCHLGSHSRPPSLRNVSYIRICGNTGGSQKNIASHVASLPTSTQFKILRQQNRCRLTS